MGATFDIQAGICGFRSSGKASSEDEQNVTFQVESGCGKIRTLASRLKSLEPFDAFDEISTGPNAQGRFIHACREQLKGCCSGCAVPVGLFKAMQVAAGLALPKDVVIELRRDAGAA